MNSFNLHCKSKLEVGNICSVVGWFFFRFLKTSCLFLFFLWSGDLWGQSHFQFQVAKRTKNLSPSYLQCEIVEQRIHVPYPGKLTFFSARSPSLEQDYGTLLEQSCLKVSELTCFHHHYVYLEFTLSELVFNTCLC